MTAGPGAYWASRKGNPGTFMVIDHPSVVGLAATTKQYRGFILVELSPLATSVSIYPMFDVFRPIPPRSSHEVQLIVEAAKKANSHKRGGRPEALLYDVSPPQLESCGHCSIERCSRV